jgi:hypothetical protein
MSPSPGIPGMSSAGRLIARTGLELRVAPTAAGARTRSHGQDRLRARIAADRHVVSLDALGEERNSSAGREGAERNLSSQPSSARKPTCVIQLSRAVGDVCLHSRSRIVTMRWSKGVSMGVMFGHSPGSVNDVLVFLGCAPVFIGARKPCAPVREHRRKHFVPHLCVWVSEFSPGPVSARGGRGLSILSLSPAGYGAHEWDRVPEQEQLRGCGGPMQVIRCACLRRLPCWPAHRTSTVTIARAVNRGTRATRSTTARSWLNAPSQFSSVSLSVDSSSR